jgi:hypothetical protein
MEGPIGPSLLHPVYSSRSSSCIHHILFLHEWRLRATITLPSCCHWFRQPGAPLRMSLKLPHPPLHPRGSNRSRTSRINGNVSAFFSFPDAGGEQFCRCSSSSGFPDSSLMFVVRSQSSRTPRRSLSPSHSTYRRWPQPTSAGSHRRCSPVAPKSLHCLPLVRLNKAHLWR